MLIDACTLPKHHVVETDVCIIGSGPAGITIARELLGKQVEVCVLESGGLDADPQIQALTQAETTGDPQMSLFLSRYRQVGGNSNRWAIKIGNGQMGVRYAPLDAIDFEQRDWLPYSGWPFSRAQLNPYYERAQAVCKAGVLDYEADRWESEQTPRLPLTPDRFTTTMFQFGPRDVFAQEYRQTLAQANNITLYYNATVVELVANDAAKVVNRVRVTNLQGSRFTVAAKVFILAQGGLENARLLLASKQQQTCGLGNQHDLVGRFFMDHPLVGGGMFKPSSPKLFDKMALYDLRRVNQVPVLGKLTPAKALMQQEQLLNVGVLLFPRPNLRQFEAIASFKHILESLAAGSLPDQIPQHLLKTLQGLDYVALASYLAAKHRQSLLHGFGRGGWSDLADNQRRFKLFQLFYQVEQSPNPNNRLTLSADRDLLGCQKLELHWRWNELDASSIRRTHALLTAELARSGLGELSLEDPTREPQVLTGGVAHHMGTTRMHGDPRQGVVNENCQVHGIDNLFVAGSSVFPTGGYANPTLTIVALSLRLADHIQQTLQPPQRRAIEVPQAA